MPSIDVMVQKVTSLPYITPRVWLVLLLLTSGTVSGLSVMVAPIWALVFVALVPLFAVLLNSTITPSRAHALTFGIIFGTAFNGAVNMSGWSVYPLDWLGINNPLYSFAIIGLLWAGLSFTMSASTALFALALFEVRDRSKNAVILVVAAGVLWIALEPTRVFFFSLFMLGPTSTLQFSYNLGSLGYAFGNASSEFWISLSRWGGMPLLSLIPVLISLCAALPFASLPARTTVRRSALAVCGVLAVFILGSLGAGAAAEQSRGATRAWNDSEEVTVVAVQTRFPAIFAPSDQELKVRTTIVYDIMRVLSESDIEPDALILPEGVGIGLHADSYARIETLMSPASLVIHGKYEHRADKPTTVQTGARTISEATAVTDKQFLAPYGEYPPYHLLFLLKLFSPTLYEKLRQHREYAGGTSVALGKAAGIPVGARICSEIFVPALYAGMAREHNAGILAHVSSMAMFHDSKLLDNAVRSAARIRAVENGLPMVQAINVGNGTAFDCRGKEIAPTIATPTFNVYAISRNDSCVGDQ